jgi:hypothetical protein
MPMVDEIRALKTADGKAVFRWGGDYKNHKVGSCWAHFMVENCTGHCLSPPLRTIFLGCNAH